jgi:hypothetical protein
VEIRHDWTRGRNRVCLLASHQLSYSFCRDDSTIARMAKGCSMGKWRVLARRAQHVRIGCGESSLIASRATQSGSLALASGECTGIWRIGGLDIRGDFLCRCHPVGMVVDASQEMNVKTWWTIDCEKIRLTGYEAHRQRPALSTAWQRVPIGTCSSLAGVASVTRCSCKRLRGGNAAEDETPDELKAGHTE